MMFDFNNINYVVAFQGLGIMVLAVITALLVIDFFQQNKRLHSEVEIQQLQITELVNLLQHHDGLLETLQQNHEQLRKEVNVQSVYKDHGEVDSYLQAINSAKAGVTVDYLVENYGMIPAEAELIISMHGKSEKSSETSKH